MMSPALTWAVGVLTLTTTSPGLISGDMLPVSIVEVWYPRNLGPTARNRNTAAVMITSAVVRERATMPAILRKIRPWSVVFSAAAGTAAAGTPAAPGTGPRRAGRVSRLL